METKTHFAIYIRVSTQKQGMSGLGLDAQKKICEDYIRSKSGECVALFKDVESGTHRDRSGLNSAIDFCKQTGSELVIAKLDRLARDVEFVFRVVNTGIEIHFCDMPVVNTMILGVFASVAQYERELTSARTKQALAAKKERGESTGGNNELWGKNTGSDRAEALRKANEASARSKRGKAMANPNNRAFREFIEDWEMIYGRITASTNFQPIADKLNERGKTTATGLPFTANRARAMYDKIKTLYA